MKTKIIVTFLFFLLAISIYIYNSNSVIVVNEISEFYIIQTGIFEKNNTNTDGIIIKDGNIYREYACIFSNEELLNIYKKKLTNKKKDYFIRVVTLDNDISKKIKKIEKKILETNKIEELNGEILLIYKDYYENKRTTN